MDWRAVADLMTDRTTKQCRERWMNVLDPSISRCGWSNAEIHTLFRAQADVGNKWAAIAARLPGRPETAVKNTFYAAVRREERRSSCAASGVAVPPPFHPAVPGVPEVAAILAEKGLVVVAPGAPSSSPSSPTLTPTPTPSSPEVPAVPSPALSALSKKRTSSMSDDECSPSPSSVFGVDLDDDDDVQSFASVGSGRDSKRRTLDRHCSMDSVDSVTEEYDALSFLTSESECTSGERSPAMTAACDSDDLFSDEGDDVLGLLTRGVDNCASALGAMTTLDMPVMPAFLDAVVASNFVDDFNWLTATASGRCGGGVDAF